MDPADLAAESGQPRDAAKEAVNRALVLADANAFGLTIASDMLDKAAGYITYGMDKATRALGSGERRAVLRDYLQITGFEEINWEDVARIANGLKPVHRNLQSEQAQVSQALAIFKKIFGHDPVFSDKTEDLAWNTLMYRIRFERDLVKEAAGIKEFASMFGRLPSAPLDWSTVRILGYILP